MRFFASALIAASIGSAMALDFCPTANGLAYQGGTGSTYIVQCSLEYYTATNLQRSKIADPIACAAACDSWTASNPSKPCAAGSWEVSTTTCYLKPGDLNANRRNNPNVISTIRTN